MMVIRQPLFQENDTTDQVAEIIRLFFRDVAGGRSGIVQETAYQVTQRSVGADASVDVKSGSVFITGTESNDQGFYQVVNDKTVNLPRPIPPNTSLSRLDVVIVRVRDSAFASGQVGDDLFNDGVLEWITGEPTSSTPVAPDLDALGYENYYKLAYVSVPAGSPSTPTTSANITDLRTPNTGGTHNRMSGVGSVFVSTSLTRPSPARHGQIIWEEDTKQLVINEGTAVANWVTYGTSGLTRWKSYASGFPVSGSGVKTWGRYIKVGRIVFGTAGFAFSHTGTGNLTGRVFCRIPVRSANPVISGLLYIGGGRALNAGAPIFSGTYWSGTASVRQNDTSLVDFASGLGLPIWDATHPFDWGASAGGFSKADKMEMFFCYESAE